MLFGLTILGCVRCAFVGSIARLVLAHLLFDDLPLEREEHLLVGLRIELSLVSFSVKFVVGTLLNSVQLLVLL